MCTGDTTEATNGTPCSPRGVRRVALDPLDSNIVYAGSYARGVWRSTDAGATWTQINAALVSTPAVTTARPEIAVTRCQNGKTRMYIAEGASGTPTARLFRSDDAQTATPASVDRPDEPSPADPGYGTYNYCTGQCWYDNFVYTPAGSPGHRLRGRLVLVRRDRALLERARSRALDRRRADVATT